MCPGYLLLDCICIHVSCMLFILSIALRRILSAGSRAAKFPSSFCSLSVILLEGFASLFLPLKKALTASTSCPRARFYCLSLNCSRDSPPSHLLPTSSTSLTPDDLDLTLTRLVFSLLGGPALISQVISMADKAWSWIDV